MARGAVALFVCCVAFTVSAAGLRQVSTASTGATVAFASLFEQYRHGDADAAVAAFSQWTAKRVSQEARLPPADETPLSRAALALFHFEAGLRNGTFGMIQPDLRIISAGPDSLEVHAAASYHIVESLRNDATRQHDVELLSFCEAWYPATAYFHGNDGATLRLFVQKSFPASADLYLLLGYLGEKGIGPAYGALQPFVYGRFFAGRQATPISTAHGQLDASMASQAEADFRQALKLNEKLTEARLRLGRVLYLVGEREQAEAELGRTFAESRQAADPFVAYVAAMFLGRLHEDVGKIDAAAGDYTEAIQLNGRAESARVALGRLRLLVGQEAAGWDAIRGVFPGEFRPSDVPVDPTELYSRGPYRTVDQRIRMMRAMVR